MRDWLLIPLDDRPCCWQFAQRLAQVELPPRELLGNFLVPGDGDAILDWLDERAAGAPGAVVALDMISWGGLVASRNPGGDLRQARGRLQRLWKICQRHKLRTLAFQTILRNAPTQTRPEDANFADLIVEFSQDPDNEDLRKLIPAQVLHDYMRVRQRNLRIYRDVVMNSYDLEYLVFALDDSKTAGWNLQELASLGEVDSLPGTDETALLLLCRALAKDRYVQLDWSHPDLPDFQGLYEDRPAGAVVEAQMKAADLKAGPSEHQLWLYGRPHQPQREARQQSAGEVDSAWLDHLTLALEAGARIVLVDLTYANGGDLSLGHALLLRGLWPRLTGYAAWNTLGNRVGTGLATLVLEATPQFLAERIADDLLYQSDFRWRAAQMLGHPGLSLSDYEVGRVQQQVFPLLSERLADFVSGSFAFSLPWQRLFEIQVDPKA